MRIEKKIWPEYFELVRKGEKKVELRLADFDLKEGDILVLREWDPKTKQFTGRKIEKEAKSVMKINPIRFHKTEEIEKYGFYLTEL